MIVDFHVPAIFKKNSHQLVAFNSLVCYKNSANRNY